MSVQESRIDQVLKNVQSRALIRPVAEALAYGESAADIASKLAQVVRHPLAVLSNPGFATTASTSSSPSTPSATHPTTTTTSATTTMKRKGRTWDESVCAVDRVVGERMVDGMLMYKVKWEADEDETWEPAANLDTAKEAIKAYRALKEQKIKLKRRVCEISEEVTGGIKPQESTYGIFQRLQEEAKDEAAQKGSTRRKLRSHKT